MVQTVNLLLKLRLMFSYGTSHGSFVGTVLRISYLLKWQMIHQLGQKWPCKMQTVSWLPKPRWLCFHKGNKHNKTIFLTFKNDDKVSAVVPGC